jgi:hypothetical protein
MFFLNSCQDNYNVCELSKDVRMKGGFYHVSSGVESAISAPLLSFSFLGSNDFIYNNQANISNISFNLNTTFDTSRYFIKLSGLLPVDTLAVVYKTHDELLSVECGNLLVQTVSSVSTTNHTIDSVVLIKPEVNTTSGENFKIYF